MNRKKTKVKYHIGVHAPGVDGNRIRRERVVCEFFRFVSITIAASRSRLRNWDRLVSLGTDSVPAQSFCAKSSRRVFRRFYDDPYGKTFCHGRGWFFSLYHLLTMAKTLFFLRPHGGGCRYCNTSYSSGGIICIFERNVLRSFFFFFVCV